MDKKGIQFPDEWRKRGFAKQLKQKVKEVKENNPDRNAEMMARKYGHTILRLPRNNFSHFYNVHLASCFFSSISKSAILTPVMGHEQNRREWRMNFCDNFR